MVGLQLARHWSREPRCGDFELTALGSGDVAPCPGYVRLGAQGEKGLVSLSELKYAQFCRLFEKETTDWVLSRRAQFPPKETCIVVNDISEGPTLAALAREGYPIVSLWHVDVVDYFNKLYLRQIVRPERLTRLYERSRGLGGRRLLPDLLKLIFEKQRETVVHSKRMIIPSRMMGETIERCYGKLLGGHGGFSKKALVVPWGVHNEEIDEKLVLEGAQRLRSHYQISPETSVVMTLSRISPEKGLHLLLKAFQLAEKDARFARKDVVLFLCGAPAFMQGASYWRRVQKEAAALRRVRVFFPGYLGPVEKREYFSLAQLFVSPSVHESYGLNIVEAMRAGLAVLASDHYGVHDLLSKSFGTMVPYPSARKAPMLLAGALKELLDAPARLGEMGRAARAAAKAMPFSAAAAKVLEAALSEVKS